jgi:hypothetical protein
MPTPVQVTYADGSVHTDRVPVEVWTRDRQTTTLTVPAGDVQRVVIDPDEFLPDVDRSNNQWPPTNE